MPAVQWSAAVVRRYNSLREAGMGYAASKFGEFLEAAPDAIVIADQQGQIVLINSLAEKLLGHACAELVGQPLAALVPERCRSQHNHTGHFQDPQARSPDPNGEAYARRKDGHE